MTGRMDYSKAEMRRQLKNEEDKYRKTVRPKFCFVNGSSKVTYPAKKCAKKLFAATFS